MHDTGARLADPDSHHGSWLDDRLIGEPGHGTSSVIEADLPAAPVPTENPTDPSKHPRSRR